MIKAVETHGKDWPKVMQDVAQCKCDTEDRQGTAVFYKAKKLLKRHVEDPDMILFVDKMMEKIKYRTWSESETKALIKAVETHGKDWTKVLQDIA